MWESPSSSGIVKVVNSKWGSASGKSKILMTKMTNMAKKKKYENNRNRKITEIPKMTKVTK
jgi:hypothetical protein